MSFRKAYGGERAILLEKDLPTKNPLELFRQWFAEVAALTELTYEEANAVSLSTVGGDGRPSSRMVLLKGVDAEGGFVFYTNSSSRKGKELAERPFAALLFFWPRVHRQVRVEGRVEQLPTEAADSYWSSRPLSSRIGSKASQQSSVIAGRHVLLERKAQLERLAEADGESAVERPQSWLGYRVVPDYLEFWQGQSDRLHDRIVFQTSKPDDAPSEEVADGWHMFRLSP